MLRYDGHTDVQFSKTFHQQLCILTRGRGLLELRLDRNNDRTDVVNRIRPVLDGP